MDLGEHPTVTDAHDALPVYYRGLIFDGIEYLRSRPSIFVTPNAAVNSPLNIANRGNVWTIEAWFRMNPDNP